MRLGRPLVPLELTTEEQTLLESWARRRTTAQACRSGCRSAARMTIAATARPHSLRRSTWRRGVSSASAIAVTAARSFSGF